MLPATHFRTQIDPRRSPLWTRTAEVSLARASSVLAGRARAGGRALVLEVPRVVIVVVRTVVSSAVLEPRSGQAPSVA
jgi:hypothetical protein